MCYSAAAGVDVAAANIGVSVRSDFGVRVGVGDEKDDNVGVSKVG